MIPDIIVTAPIEAAAANIPKNNSVDIMDDDATQPSTQPFLDPRRLGRHNSGLTDEDSADVICILHPASPLAHKVVAGIARTAPQHILQNDDLKNITLVDTENVPPASGTCRDIALRMSSCLKNPCQGFCFGRNASRCDIVLANENDPKRLSNLHFRIYFNSHGILMLQDTSMNGTYVDGYCLKGKGHNPRQAHSRVLTNSSIIQLLFAKREDEIKFILRIPSREGFESQFGRNLKDYISKIGRFEHPARPALAETSRNHNAASPRKAAADRASRYQHANIHDSEAEQLARSASGDFHFGMQWTGGLKYNVIGTIGKGAFATVYKLATKDAGEVFAAKEIEKRKFIKHGVLNRKVNNEMQIMKRLKHPHIVQFVDHAETPAHLYIIMEYVEGGELLTFMNLNGAIPEDIGQSISRQVLHALSYLHKMKITHRDVKPDNILIASTDPMIVKLSDFGLSKVIDDEQTFLKTFCGTLLYCAPEVYPDYAKYVEARPPVRRRHFDFSSPKRSPYHESVDIWSFGAVLYHILCAKPPYVGRGENGGTLMLRNIMTKDLDIKPLVNAGISEIGIDFVAGLLERDPAKRPVEEECFRHLWLKDVPDVVEVASRSKRELEDIKEDIARDDELRASQLSSFHEGASKGNNSYGISVHPVVEDTLAATVAAAAVAADADADVFLDDRQRSLSDDIAYPSLEKFAEEFLTRQEDPLPQNSAKPKRLFGEVVDSTLDSSELLGNETRSLLGRLGTPSEPRSMDDLLDDLDHDLETTRAPSPCVTHQFSDFDDDLNAFGNHGTRRSPSTTIRSKSVGVEDRRHRLDPPTKHSLVGGKSLPSIEKLRIKMDTLEARSASASAAAFAQPAPVIMTCPGKIERPNDDCDKSEAAKSPNHVSDPTDCSHLLSSKSLQVKVQVKRSSTQVVDELNADDVRSSKMRRIESPRTEDSVPEVVKASRSQFSIVPDTRQAYDDHQATLLQAGKSSNRTNTVAAAPPLTKTFGALTSEPGSFAEICFALQHRENSFGRGMNNTHRYLDISDTRISRSHLQVFFWSPKAEELDKQGLDWTQLNDVYAYVSTGCERHPIFVNGVALPKRADNIKSFAVQPTGTMTTEATGYTGRQAGICYGKIYSGDCICLFKSNHNHLTFKVQIYWGPSAKTRPEYEPFQKLVQFVPNA